MPSLLAPLLPAFIAAAEGMVGAIDGSVWPEEAARMEKAVAHRRAEFHAGRALARRALAALGALDAMIPSGEGGAPVWPDGFTGSISHSGPRVCAVAARCADVRGIGVDIEEQARFHPELERRVLTPREAQTTLAGLSEADRGAALATVFSAKEAFYKMQFPIARRRLGFHDAEVALDNGDGHFELTLLSPAEPFGAGERFAGRWRLTEGFVVTVIWLETAAWRPNISPNP